MFPATVACHVANYCFPLGVIFPSAAFGLSYGGPVPRRTALVS